MNNYLKAVTLGAFTWKNEERVSLFLKNMREAGKRWIILHFFLLTICLNFPVVLTISQLEPVQFYSRLYGENFIHALPENVRDFFTEETLMDSEVVREFNMLMYQDGYGANVLMPILGMLFGIMIIIQLMFYLSTAWFLWLSRMNVKPLSFKDRMGLALYSSTLPLIAATIFGFFLPTVHIIVFYFAVIFIVFHRSSLCPDG
ncbi:MAG: DUF1189 domain-containing protein [Treponema sp.]|jgi:hypothetical protein|nr:DUF1189 domain-containing protein [Treponema sp.]